MSQNDIVENIYVSLIKDSWQKYEQKLYNKQVDELLIGALITSLIQQEYSLIDFESDGRNHYLRFEHFPSKERIIFELINTSEDLISAKVMGRQAKTTIGFGYKVNNFNSVINALKTEFKSNFIDASEPGLITVDADLAAGYVYALVSLILDLDQYFKPEEPYKADIELLGTHLGATVYCLSKYLKGRFRGG